VDGTPTFYANGTKLFNGLRRLPNSDDFKTLVDSIVAHTPQPRARPTRH